MIKHALLIGATASLLLAPFQNPKMPKLPGGGGRVKADLDQAIARLDRATRAELKTANERREKFFEKVIAENQMPADNYAGPDAASLKEAARQVWSKNFPKFKILRIGLSGEWSRTEGWKWEDKRSAWYKFDASRLNGYPTVDTGHPKYVYIRSMSNTKDHLNGDRIETGVGIWDPADKPHPAGTYLRANIK